MRIALLLLALSQVESHNRDGAVGASGEVSRYQIMPYVWKAYSSSRDYKNEKVSTAVASRILTDRISRFQKMTNREPNGREVYALWNAPGLFENLGFRYSKLPAVIRKRCEKFDATYSVITNKNRAEFAVDTASQRRHK